MRLEGKVAIVTGAGRGIGRAIAGRFAQEGAEVVIAELDAPLAEKAAGEIGQAGGRAHAIPTDVRQPEAVRSLVEQSLSQFGKLDVLVNNAALILAGPSFLELTLEQWEDVLATNLTGAFQCGQAVARAMVERGTAGRIINLASINSLAAERNMAAYVASKGGILALTRAMAVDLAPFGILVNCIAPGPILTETAGPVFSREPYRTGVEKGVPLGRPGEPAEVASAAVFLASDESTFVSGSCLLVDGGYMSLLRFD